MPSLSLSHGASRLRLLALVFVTLSTLDACGGGGDAGSATPPPPPPPGQPIGTAGVFDVDYGQFRGVYTFLDDGSFSGVHFVGGNVLAGHPRGPLTTADSITSLESIAWANFIDDAMMVGAQEPNGRFGRTFNDTTLDVTISGSMGSFHARATTQKKWSSGDSRTLYGDAIPLATLAGPLTGIVRTAGLGTPMADATLTLDASGHWTATVGACTYDGTWTPHGSTGIYDAHATTTGAACRFLSPLQGIVTPLSFDGATHLSLALQLDTADKTQSAVFILSR